ncbi:hypothetical protein GA0115252_15146 [Streptomyces sp. DfronAA-171]|nr:hypothetical protein GA0115252_15146 [Streptomyces sp. DfronAA-171]
MGGHAPGRSGGPQGAHGGGGLDSGDLPVGGLVRARTGTDVEHGAGIAERGPDLRGDARLGAAGLGDVVGADPLVQPGSESGGLSTVRALEPRLQLAVDGAHHGGRPVPPFAQQAAQPPQARDGVGLGSVDQLPDLPQPEPEPPVRQHLPQPLDIPRAVRPVPARRPPGRPGQPDGVVIPRRPHRHPGQLGNPPDSKEFFRHGIEGAG